MSIHPEREALRRPEGLSAEKRRALLGHVAGCARCREVYTAEDPTRLFALLGNRRLDPGLLEEVSAAVMAGLDDSLPAPDWPERSWSLKAVGAWAAGILLAVGLFSFATRHWREQPPGPVTHVVDQIREVSQPRGEVALLSSPGQAELVALTVGDVQVVMIFDEGLEL